MATFRWACWHCGASHDGEAPDPPRATEINCTRCGQAHGLAIAHTRAFKVAAVYTWGRCRCQKHQAEDYFPRGSTDWWCMLCGHHILGGKPGETADPDAVSIARMSLAAYQADRQYTLGIWSDDGPPARQALVEAMVVGVIGALGKRLLEANEKLREATAGADGARAATMGIAQALDDARRFSASIRAAHTQGLAAFFDKAVREVTDQELWQYLVALAEWEKVGKQLDAKTPGEALVNVIGGQAEQAKYYAGRDAIAHALGRGDRPDWPELAERVEKLQVERDRALTGTRVIAEALGEPEVTDALQLAAMVTKERERADRRQLAGADVVNITQGTQAPPLEDVLDALADLGAAMGLAMRIERGSGATEAGWWLTVGDGGKYSNAKGGTFWELVRGEVPRLRARAAAMADERADGVRRLREVSAE